MLRTESFYTIEEFRRSIKDTMNIYNMNFEGSEPLNDLVIDMFRKTLDKYVVTLKLSNNEVERYRGIGTKRLSKDLYKTTDMFYIINNLNNILHPSDVLATGNTLLILNNNGIKELQKYYNEYSVKY